MKILHVISSLDPRFGGPPMALFGLARGLVAAGIDLDIINCFQPNDDRTTAKARLDEKVHVDWVGPIDDALWRHPDLPATVDRAVARADLVHIHGVWEDIQHQAARAAMRHCKPYLIRPCGMLDPWSLRAGKLKKQFYLLWRLRKNLNRATYLHFTTDIERDLTKPLHLKSPSIVEPNGVDLTEFANLPEKGAFRRQYGIAPDRKVLLFMSRLHHKKGLDHLVPAFAKLKDPNVMLVIVGGDADGYQAKVETMADQSGVRDRIIFTGMLKGPARVPALADADLFVLPSYQENFGIAVVEALAAGTPVVISDQVNIYPDILAGNVGGVVPMDVDKLANEIERWLGDESLRRSAGERARAFALERYDWSQIAKRWVEHYERLLRFGGGVRNEVNE